MTQVRKSRLPVLMMLIIAAAMALAAGTVTAQTVYADDVIQLDKISFDGAASDDWWGHYYSLDSMDAALTKEQLNIKVLDAAGNEVPADAYTLTLYHTWWDETSDKEQQVPADYPVGLLEADPSTESGFNEMVAKVEPVSGRATGNPEQAFMVYYRNTLDYVFSEIFFDGAKTGGWRMMDYSIVPKNKVADPVVKVGIGTGYDQILTKDQDYTIRYFTRVNDATDDGGLIASGGKELDAMPTKTGKYYCQIEGKGEYKGGKTLVFDIASSANPTYIKALTRKSKPVTVKAAKLKKAGQTVAASKLIKLQNGIVLVSKNHFMGFKAYKKLSGAKCLSINANTGKVTVKKGTKKGTYKIKVQVHPAGIYEDAAAGQTTVTCWIKVK